MFRTPEKVLQKIGLGQQAKQLRTAFDTYQTELPKNIDYITSWSKEASNPGASKRIFQYLDGRKIELNPTELKVAGEIKQWLSGWADRLKLPKDKRISNYITHIFEKGEITKEFEVDPELANIMRTEVAKSVYDPFTLQRQGAPKYIEDAWRALDAYVKRATRKVNLDPVLKDISEASKGLEDSQFKYVKSYIDRVNMRPTDIDNLLDNTIKQVFGYGAGQRPTTAITQKTRQWVYRGLLGLNPASVLRNLSQGANTYSELGERYTITGYAKLLKNWNSSELERVGILKNNFIEDRTISATRKLWEKIDKGLFYMFETAEKINRGAAYYGAKSKAINQGMSEKQAVNYAKGIVAKTQFLFSKIDTPAVLQSDISKTLGQFLSFGVKQTEFLTEKILAKDVAGILIKFDVRR
jgi:hypothetical protein